MRQLRIITLKSLKNWKWIEISRASKKLRSTSSFAVNAIFSSHRTAAVEVKNRRRRQSCFALHCSRLWHHYAKSRLLARRYWLTHWQRHRTAGSGFNWILEWSGLGWAFLNRHFDWSHGGNIGSVGLKSRWCCQTQSVWLLALKWRLVSNFVPLGVGISLTTISRWIDCFIVVVDDGWPNSSLRDQYRRERHSSYVLLICDS